MGTKPHLHINELASNYKALISHTVVMVIGSVYGFKCYSRVPGRGSGAYRKSGRHIRWMTVPAICSDCARIRPRTTIYAVIDIISVCYALTQRVDGRYIFNLDEEGLMQGLRNGC